MVTPKSRRGVFNRLAESTYYYCAHGLRFYFSSRFNQERFMARLTANYQEHEAKFEKRYHVQLKSYTLPDILLYSQIESRGFRIVDENGGEATCPEQLEFMVRVQVAK